MMKNKDYLVKDKIEDILIDNFLKVPYLKNEATNDDRANLAKQIVEEIMPVIYGGSQEVIDLTTSICNKFWLEMIERGYKP